MLSDRLTKVTSLICYSLLTMSLIIAHNAPTIGYESSIYESTPLIVWFILLLSTVHGVFIVFSQIYSGQLEKGLWKIGFLNVYLCYITFISLFIIRGYYLWCMGGDPASHIGFTNHTILTSNIPKNLFYPILHIYLSQIYFVSNINILLLSKLLPLFFGVLYVPFMYLLSKIIFSDQGQRILSTLASTTLINGWYLNLTPNGLSNLYFPLLLFIFLKVTFTKDTRWELLGLIMVFFYPIFHPVPTLAYIIFICTLFIPNYLSNKKNNCKITENKSDHFLRFKLTLLLLLFIWSITWISSFYIWGLTIQNLHTLINEGGPTQISILIESMNYATGYGYNIIQQALKMLSGSFVYTLIAIVSFPIIWKGRDKFNNLFSLFGPFLFLYLFIIIFHFLNLMSFSPLRLITYTTTISTLFIGYFLDYLINIIKTKCKKIYILSFIGLIFLLLIVWINAVLTLYPSPYTLSPSYQTTHSEVEGIAWLFENRDLNTDITGINIAQFRFGDLLLTFEQARIQRLYWAIPDGLKVPYHFGYDNKSLLSNHYNQSLYMGIDEVDKLIYEDVFPEIAKIRWVPSDFEKLNWDSSLYKIYSSKKFEVFYINNSEKK
ncbi:MAG: hypothetical protein WAX23_03240 [Methanosarcina sp.]